MYTLAASNPVDHVVNMPYAVSPDGVWLWSGHAGNLLLSGLIMLVLFPWAASKIATGPESDGNRRYLTNNLLAQMIEVICVYLRDEVARPLLHHRTDRFMPFLWTLFFFILINNLLGLIPIVDLLHLASPGLRNAHSTPLGGTATQNLFVTAALAFVSFLVVNIAGMRELGVGGYLRHLTAGASPMLWPLLVPIEILGTFIKPVALALRLFANMTAGHILLATLFMFAGMGVSQLAGGGAGVLIGPTVTLISAAGAIGVYFLELFVALLQAFVFMFLTTVFISQLSHHDEHEHGDGHHGHEHAHA